MKPSFRNNRDFWAGLMFFGIGSVAMLIARDYRYGTAVRMGPGYYPTLLGGVLVALGVLIMIKGCAAMRRSGAACRSMPGGR